VWIVVGAALVAGTVATIAIAHHGTECSGMCLDWSKP
jgi:hypothetical protein